MSAADYVQSIEAVGLLQFGDCARVPPDALSFRAAWPVTAWRALVPIPRRTGSDPLQRAVLRMIAAGCTDPHAIGKWLDVPAELIRTVTAVYRGEGYIESSEPVRLSYRGKILLLEDDEITFSDSSHETGWIFRDDWSGDIIPFLVEDNLPWCSRDKRAEFEVLLGDRVASDHPGVLGIRQALSDFRRYVKEDRDSERVHQSSETIDEQASADSPLPKDSDRPIPGIVQLLWEKPEPVYIPVWIYFRADEPHGWQIATSLPLAPLDRWFRSKLNWASGRLPALQNQIARWTGQAEAMFPPSPTLDEAQQRAVLDFPFLAIGDDLADVRALLARTYRARSLYELNPENIDVYLTRCCSTLEAILTACLSQCSNANQASRLIRDESFVDQLREIASLLKLELPDRFCNPHYSNKARKAARGGGETPMDRAIALMFCAVHDRSSSARKAFAACPDILVHIDTVTRFRNTHGGHYDRRADFRDQSTMAEQIDKSTRQVVSTLGQSFFGDRK